MDLFSSREVAPFVLCSCEVTVFLWEDHLILADVIIFNKSLGRLAAIVGGHNLALQVSSMKLNEGISMFWSASGRLCIAGCGKWFKVPTLEDPK